MDAMWMPDSPILRLAWIKRLSGGGGGEPVYKTVSGNPVTFSAVAAPLQQLRVDFSAVQSGSGVPSPTNVRPISGWTGLTATVNGSAVPVSWETEAGTVCGGYVDLVGGELVATHIKRTFDGSSGFSVQNKGRFVIWRSIEDMAVGYFATDPLTMCDRAEKVVSSGTDLSKLEILIGYGARDIYLYNLNYVAGVATTEDVASWLNGNPITVTYPLATPIHYQLTPQTIRTITGSNTISSDGGSLTVTYRES